MKQSRWMWFVHHFIRVVWSLPIGLLYSVVYLIIFIVSENARIDYKNNKKRFFNHANLITFAIFFKDEFQYKWDGFGNTNSKLKGLLDHDNRPLEYFISWGDCDDSKYIVETVSEMHNIIAYRIGMIGKGIKTWHYDCAIETWENNQKVYILFDYGRMIKGVSLQDCLEKLCYFYNWNSKKLKWWVCIW